MQVSDSEVGKLTFSLLAPQIEPAAFFSIQETSGILSIGQVIDREQVEYNNYFFQALHF